MIRQIYMDYNSLPNVREVTLDEIRFFYQGCIENWKFLGKEKQKIGE